MTRVYWVGPASTSHFDVLQRAFGRPLSLKPCEKYLRESFSLAGPLSKHRCIHHSLKKGGVPADLILEARGWTNPLEATDANIEKGKAIFLGKAFCATCHGGDGRGLGDIQGLRADCPEI
jgi:mono/diheme cytochrome c family protein